MESGRFYNFVGMSVFNIPSDFLTATEAPEFLVYPYQSTAEATTKSRIIITSHLFSFVQEGEKEVYFNDQSVLCGNEVALLMASGNCLMTERASPEKHYRSLLFFFSEARLSALKGKYPDLFPSRVIQPGKACFVIRQDDFVRPFVASLQHVPGNTPDLAASIWQLKFEEMMLYLAHTYPATFPDFIAALRAEQPDSLVKRVVDNNINSHLTLDELAFLCHMSLSTFKRKFESLYSMPPIRWFHEKRMQQAAHMLRYQNLKASEIHEDLGYENLSSFIQAFKKEFGVTPKAYQEQR